MFECKICDFSSVRSTDLKRHEQSKKHIFKMNNNNDLKNNNNIQTHIYNKCSDECITVVTKKSEYICECNKVFKYRQSLSFHRKTCTYTSDNINLNNYSKEQITESTDNQLLVTMFNEMTNIKAQLEQLTKNTQITNNTNSNNTTTNNNNNTTINNKTINVYSYVNSNYNQVEPLKLLKQKDIAKLLILDDTYSDKHSIEDVMVHEHSKHTLNQFIGYIIIKEYKKEDPKDQKIWTSDISRLTFIVRNVLNKNEKIWSKDKGGICINEFIITPILEEIKIMINEFNNECNNKIKLPKSDYEALSDKISGSLKIIYDITTKKLHKSILSYIAPHFQLDICLLTSA
jgi:hypothetical protein